MRTSRIIIRRNAAQKGCSDAHFPARAAAEQKSTNVPACLMVDCIAAATADQNKTDRFLVGSVNTCIAGSQLLSTAPNT